MEKRSIRSFSLPIIGATLLLFGCAQTEQKTDIDVNEIEVGNYVFDFPPDYELITEQGIDSYVGKVKGDSMSFQFDFGYYSNDFEQPVEEYLENGDWQFELPYRFMKEGIIYDDRNTPEVDVLSIRPATKQDSAVGSGSDYIAKCRHDSIEFDFSIYIPSKIKDLYFEIDTIDDHYRKIVWAKDPKNGRTGIYIKDLNSYKESINGSLALSMTSRNLTYKQQETALMIFKTGRPKQ